MLSARLDRCALFAPKGTINSRMKTERICNFMYQALLAPRHALAVFAGALRLAPVKGGGRRKRIIGQFCKPRTAWPQGRIWGRLAVKDDVSAYWRNPQACAMPKEALRRERPTQNTGVRAIDHTVPVAPAFFDFNSSRARVISGSTPLSISACVLKSSMSAGTPWPS